jgi:TPR repeat protein
MCETFDFNNAWNMLFTTRFDDARRIAMTESERTGNPGAQHLLGRYYVDSDNKDKELADHWFTRSFASAWKDTLCPISQFVLGRCHENGIGGAPKDLTKAAEWYMKAALQGSAAAQNNMGFCLEVGDGVEKNVASAALWYQKSALQGNAAAQTNLGLCYNFGKGVERSISTAKDWYRTAAEQGNPNSQNQLALCLSDISDDDNKQKAVDLLAAAAKQRSPYAMYNMGLWHETGKCGIEISLPKSFQWFLKAAEVGNSAAQFRVGNCYIEGKGIPISREKAVEWWTKASKQSHAQSQSLLQMPENNIFCILTNWPQSNFCLHASAQIFVTEIFCCFNEQNNRIGDCLYFLPEEIQNELVKMIVYLLPGDHQIFYKSFPY